ncbi:MAG TPA: hypothetical protein VMS32_10170 [Verrucomicrobiae bacterium]|jgi:hypothetical protein|nr:hypothetical protein [Verrucomicrobiae bacterium]
MNRLFGPLAVTAALVVGMFITTSLPALAGTRLFSVWNTGPDPISVQFPEGVAGPGIVVETVSSHDFKRYGVKDEVFKVTVKGPKYGGCETSREIPRGKNITFEAPCTVKLS